MTNPAQKDFRAFLGGGVAAGNFRTDDVLAAILPLMRQVLTTHEHGEVAPLDGAWEIQVDETHLWFHQAEALPPRRRRNRIDGLLTPSRAIEVIGEYRQDADLDEGMIEVDNLSVGVGEGSPTRPVYLPGYTSWEERLDHHDELTDIFLLGLLLASLSLGLHFDEIDDLRRFVASRGNLFALEGDLHPVIASAIVRMTELDPHRRPQDLASLIAALENYRDQALGQAIDYRQQPGFQQAALADRRSIVLDHLRERLFEISRRNRLIYFRPTQQTLNLTEASVPLVLDYRNIAPEKLFTLNAEVLEQLVRGDAINLNRYLAVGEAIYAPSILDSIRQEATRSTREFGFSQLRLVLVFLRWHNLKESPDERIHSPLLLLPVELTRQKGIRDSFVLTPVSALAEVNPALRFHLKQLYNLDLPEAIDLAKTTVDAFYGYLVEQIHASEPGITLKRLDRPQIKLIYDNARRRLNNYRRRLRPSGRGLRQLDDIDYCYERENYRPLGLQLFLQRIRPALTPFENVLGALPRPRHPGAGPLSGLDPAPDASQRTRNSYHLQTGSETNPYVWDFDQCAVTLGNFNYRRMTLVQDYARLIESGASNPAFEEIFTLEPRPHDAMPVATPDPEDLHLIVPGDPTQISAIQRARLGRSYIIQGPPGTGKSQTITNLIADYVARSKRVLFVCEKRAAIDVVFHRLKQQDLDPLTVLIHDSQTDKKAFVLELKETYERILNSPGSESCAPDRQSAIEEIHRHLSILGRVSQAMTTPVESAGISLRELLDRLIELSQDRPSLTAEEEEALPPYLAWREHGGNVRRLATALRDLGEPPIFARSPLRHLQPSVAEMDGPVARVQGHLRESRLALGTILQATTDPKVGLDGNLSIAGLQDLLAYATIVLPLAEIDLLFLLRPSSPDARRFEKMVRDFGHRQEQLEKAAERTTHWRQKLDPDDTRAALERIRRLEVSPTRFFRPEWWRLTKLLGKRFDRASCVVTPSWSQVLEELNREHEAIAALEAAESRFFQEYGLEDAIDLLPRLATIRASLEKLPPLVVRFHERLAEQPDEAAEIVTRLSRLQAPLGILLEEAGAFLADLPERELNELASIFDEIESSLGLLPELLPNLQELIALPPSLRRAVARLPLTCDQLEAAIAVHCLNGVYRTDRGLQRFESRLLARHLDGLSEAYDNWMRLNGRLIREQVEENFRRRVNLAAMPTSQLSPEERIFKREYSRGRRELEHEFGKTMRYRPIRDLVDDETGLVAFDIKPIWLMSPLSVADTIPLDSEHFDVVIFDEASQIRLEEAVPAVYRAPQVIVVGDEMQLPPSNFFSATRSSDEESLTIEDEGSLVEYDLNADSFLTHTIQNLPHTLLGWHYRSRYESLINFSNHAFYQGQLLTIPDRHLPPAESPDIVVDAPEDAVENIEELLGRSLSFHYLEGGIYEKRRNPAEAAYIAHLVKALLQAEVGRSIGIVAFSEAQQGEIEDALNRLAREDAPFTERLEAEMEREEDDQFCGLFVKNLENVQGDERDIIILSICYGHDRQGQMRMNFGPINKSGGEKRLNVIFSRAKHHMVVVSSIRHFDITNEYNDGANCLRHFLEYAAAVSNAAWPTAQRLLGSLTPQRATGATTADRAVVAGQLGARLRASGWRVDENVGQSSLRCDLAVCRQGDSAYRLGILIDSAFHYTTGNLLERYLLRPGVLRAFGWPIAMVLAKDWQQDPERLIARLERQLNGEEEPEEQLPDEVPAEPEPASPPTAPAEPATSPTDSPDDFTRYFVFGEPATKFWEVTVEGCNYRVRYGAIGKKGQILDRGFTTPEAARKEGRRMSAAKLRKGYREIQNG